MPPNPVVPLTPAPGKAAVPVSTVPASVPAPAVAPTVIALQPAGSVPAAVPTANAPSNMPPPTRPPVALPVPEDGNILGSQLGRLERTAAKLAAARVEAGAVPASEGTPPVEPPPAAPAPPPPPIAPPPVATVPPPVIPVVPAVPATPAAPPAEPALPADATPAQKNAWELINQAEKKLAAERAKFKDEGTAFAGRQTTLEAELARLKALEEGLRADPTGALASYGWQDDRLAQHLVARHNGEQPPAVSPAPAAPAPTEDDPRINELQNALISLRFETAGAAPEYAIIRDQPGGYQRAIQKAGEYYMATGTPLTPQQALGMVQDELVTEHKALIAKRDGDPSWQKALGRNGSAAPPVEGQPGPAGGTPPAPPPAVEPALTSLTNDVSASPSLPPIPTDRVFTEDERIARARQAIAHNRAG